MTPIKLTPTILITILLLTCAGCKAIPPTAQPPTFDGQRALSDIERQLSFGPRTPGSKAHAQTLIWLQDELAAVGWGIRVQEENLESGHTIKNVVATRGAGSPWIILGAHYDSRLFADRDPIQAQRDRPVPGANDGASGVAVLLELARVLPDDFPGKISLIFFDAEDNGEIEGWDWILGSRAFVESLETYPDAVVIIDMIGDADLEIFWERNSDYELITAIWDQAAQLGYGENFILQPKYTMIDDHTPFVMAGIPTVLIIDFDYAHWHTTNDTLDKISAESLQAVGDTLLHWLLAKWGSDKQ